MDILFKEVDIIKIDSTSRYPYKLDVHLDNISEDDLFNTIADYVDDKMIIEHFELNELVNKMSDQQKEELLDHIGENFIKGYYGVKEYDIWINDE